MKRLVFYLLLITTTGCDTERATEPDGLPVVTPITEGESQQAKEVPRLWLDDDAGEMIKAMSDERAVPDTVYVIRWEHSELCGWVKLESQDGSTPLSYDLSVPPEHSDPDSDKDVSGWLVVAIRKLSDTPGDAYDVRIEEEYSLRDTDGTDIFGFKSRRGMLVSAAKSDNSEMRSTAKWGSDHVELKKYNKDGQEEDWLKLRLGSTAPLSESPPDVQPEAHDKP